MQLGHKITIDLLEFVKSGKFDYIKLGKTKDWIINNFSDPDFLTEAPETYNYPVWQYGNIEFHFNNDELCLIYSDYIDSLNGGKSLELHKWIFSEPKKLTLSFVVKQLNCERINFKVEHSMSSARVIILKSGVQLDFGLNEKNKKGSQNDSNEFLLVAFNLAQD